MKLSVYHLFHTPSILDCKLLPSLHSSRDSRLSQIKPAGKCRSAGDLAQVYRDRVH
jgi:hypothetical protein